MTPAQLVVLRADILANPILAAKPLGDDSAFEIAAFYNATASPDFWAWRTSVSKIEIVQSAGPDGTTFTWVGNGFITRSVGEQAAWRELFAETGAINAALANVRQAFTDIFSGTGNAAANRTHLQAIARRKVTVGEKLFATGAGTTAAPGTMTFEGAVSFQGVNAARAV